MRKTVSLLMIAVCIVVLSAAFVAAQTETQASGSELSVLAVDVPGTGIVFMRLRVAPEGMSLLQLRDLIWQRISDALRPGLERGQPLDGSAVRVVVPEDGDPEIYIGDHFIIAVDKEHAAINGSTQTGLAEVWAANLALALDKWAHINRPML